MAILEVKNLSKVFDKLEVIRDISFSMEKGESLAIIGSSGSGKTTLLRCLNGLERPNAGTISVNGKIIFDAQRAGKISAREQRLNQLHFGLVFQQFHLFPQYTVLGNVTLASELLAKGGKITRPTSAPSWNRFRKTAGKFSEASAWKQSWTPIRISSPAGNNSA